MDLVDKVCVITGASSGIGKSLATKLSLRGAKVVLAARRNSKLEEIREERTTQLQLSNWLLAQQLVKLIFITGLTGLKVNFITRVKL